jgi:putative ABC transport system permease protein
MLWKDFFVEIRRTLPRYLSILFIVALGVAFFSGVRSSEPDMRLSADTYYDEQNFMDIRIISTLGLTDTDLEAIRQVEGVTEAVGIYSVDAFLDTETASLVATVQSLTGNINQYYITEGRLPENTEECLLDASFLLHGDYAIGDRITLRSGSADALTDSLSSISYTIVGFGYSPMYLSWDRASASIGTGSATGFVAVVPETFLTDVYSQIFVTTDQADSLICMTDSYDETVDRVQEAIEAICADRLEERYHQVTDEPYAQLAEAKADVAQGWQDVEDAQTELDDALATLEDGESQLADGYDQIATAKVEITTNEATLAAARKTLADGQAEYEAGEAEYEANAAKLADAEDQLTEAKISYAIAENQISSYREDLDSYKERLSQYESRYQSAKPLVTNKYNEGDSITKFDLLAGYGERIVDQALDDMNSSDDSSHPSNDSSETDSDGSDDGQFNLDDWIPDREDIPVSLSSWSDYVKELYDNGSISEATRDQLLNLTAEDVANLMLAYYIVAFYESSEATAQTLENAIAEGEAQLADAKQQIADAQAQVKDGKAQLEAGSRDLVKAAVTISLAEDEIADGEKQLAEAKQQLEEAETTLEEKKQELADGWAEYYKQKAEADIQIADATSQLEDAEKEIAENERTLSLLENPQWYVLDRDSVQAYVEYRSDAERIGAVGKVFPVIFFLVAALVSLTSMTRMVEEQRTLIGTLKALGYGKGAITARYLLYALSASLIGSVMGVLAGEYILPQVILTAYGLMYLNLPVLLTPVNWYFGVMSTLIAVLCTTLATFGACYRELIAGPAQLMRPAAPKQGKRVFLERISFIWDRLGFTSKATVRNLFRYKKRFFMTIFGIGGCMALLMVSFGLRDSIQSIIKHQYKTIWVYDAYATIDDNATEEERDSLPDEILSIDGTKNILEVRLMTMDVEANGVTKSAHLFVPDSLEYLDEFVILKNRVSKEAYALDDDSVIITEKLASMLSLSQGDTFTLLDGDTTRYTVTVSGIAENYLYNYVYMTPALYQQLYGTDPVYNTIYINQDENSPTSEDDLSRTLLAMDSITAVTLISNLNATISDMMTSLNLVVMVLIVSAGLLAYIVLYNLNNINITERRRELATLKVLGFYPMEVASYVYRENVFLTICGVLLGMVFGIFLHRFVVLTLEVDIMMFGRTIHPASYVYSVLITFLFAIFVNGLMYFNLKKIDMVESLKSVE